MPGRDIPLVTDQIYHVFNRGISDQPTFFSHHDYQRAIDTMLYYRYAPPPVRYSFFMRLPRDQRQSLFASLEKMTDKHVELLAYCYMPNHIHFLLQQTRDNGISTFMGNFQNSYTRFINTKQERHGPLFQGKFKAVRISTEEQLLHVSRYIHLNPYTSYIVKSLKDLEQYPYSSLSEYLNNLSHGRCKVAVVLDHFKKMSYRDFVFDQAAYQRDLGNIRHLTLED